jgi:hypothetical protein
MYNFLLMYSWRDVCRCVSRMALEADLLSIHEKGCVRDGMGDGMGSWAKGCYGLENAITGHMYGDVSFYSVWWSDDC